MAYRITEDCVNCGVCLDECPSGAIEEGNNIYQINPDICDNCGTCKETCPTEAVIDE